MDTTNSLFEHIRNRLPTDYNYGDDGTVINNNIPNHKTFQQSIREDHEGDVGIFELNNTLQSKYSGYSFLISEIQIVVVTIDGDIEKAKQYLADAFKNINDITNRESSKIKIIHSNLVSIVPLGKNSKGLQMVSLTSNIKYNIK